MEKLLNLLFPSKCLICKTGWGLICQDCLNETPLSENQICLVCGRPSENGVTHVKCVKETSPKQFISFFEYEDSVRKCIRLSKYHRKYFSLIKDLAKHAFREAVWLDNQMYKNYIVVPIPLSKEKLKLRGFNQAEKLAELVAKSLNLKMNTRFLKRVRNTKTQYQMTRIERFENLKNAFEADAKMIENRNILLVDDICTTGATFLSASEELSKAGAENIICLSLCTRFLRRAVKKVPEDI